MEQEIDMLSDNATSIEQEYHYERPLISHIYEYMDIFISLIVILLDAVIIYVILRNKRMRTRTNIILLNWCISHMLYVFSDLYLFAFLIMERFDNSAYEIVAACTIYGSETVYMLVCTIFMIIMITPSLMKRTTIKTAVMLATTYTIASIVFLAEVIMCSCRTYYEILQISFLLTFAYLFISVVIKDINRCRKQSGIPTSGQTLTRLNIAKIFVYNYMLFIILEILIDFTIPWDVRYNFRMLNFLNNFEPLCIGIYLYRTNKTFKICILSLSKFDFTSTDVDATILFEEDSDVEENQHVKVSLNVSRPDVVHVL